jgi:SatD family protein
MQSMVNLYGVLIADVVASRSTPDLRSSLNDKLRIASIAQLDEQLIRVPYAVTAGDEFQVVAARLERIPKLMLDLRRRLLPFRLRIGVGIGEVEGQIRPPVNRIAGEAFENAREAIMEIRAQRKYPTLTIFRSSRGSFDRVANLIYGLHDTLIRRTTTKQWETIAVYLTKNRVDRTAKALKIDRSTASRNLRRGFFWQMEDTILGMEELIKESFSDCT